MNINTGCHFVQEKLNFILPNVLNLTSYQISIFEPDMFLQNKLFPFKAAGQRRCPSFIFETCFAN